MSNHDVIELEESCKSNDAMLDDRKEFFEIVCMKVVEPRLSLMFMVKFGLR